MNWFYFLNCFFVYSFLGWVFESIVMTYENKAITNRGFARGPFCPIYGLGALSVYFILQPIADHHLAVFLCGMLMATLIEYITAVVMTRLFGGFWWNYDNKRFNYHGVICLESSLCWGLMSFLTFVLFQPLIEKFVNIYYIDHGKTVAIVLLLFYSLDFFSSFRRARHKNNDINNIDNDDEDVVSANA
jgi:uncharacterized membrane protein